jgi:hypothetical protein
VLHPKGLRVLSVGTPAAAMRLLREYCNVTIDSEVITALQVRAHIIVQMPGTSSARELKYIDFRAHMLVARLLTKKMKCS